MQSNSSALDLIRALAQSDPNWQQTLAAATSVVANQSPSHNSSARAIAPVRNLEVHSGTVDAVPAAPRSPPGPGPARSPPLSSSSHSSSNSLESRESLSKKSCSRNTANGRLNNEQQKVVRAALSAVDFNTIVSRRAKTRQKAIRGDRDSTYQPDHVFDFTEPFAPDSHNDVSFNHRDTLNSH